MSVPTEFNRLFRHTQLLNKETLNEVWLENIKGYNDINKSNMLTYSKIWSR